jgi:uncharacterized glyoxalase superfamily protein PhnB
VNWISLLYQAVSAEIQIKEKMMKVATYLYFKHNAKEAIETYKTIFGADVVCEYLYNDNMTQNQALVGRIFHAELKIGDLNLYVADSDEETSRSSVRFVVEFTEESDARECLDRIAQDGNVISDFEKMPFGPTIAQAKDKFGVTWDIVVC